MKKIFNLLLIFILMIIGLGFNSNFHYVDADAGQYNQTRTLTNLIDNGDFSVDTNSDGLADNWSKGASHIHGASSITNNVQRLTNIDAVNNFIYLRQSIETLNNHVYYLNSDIFNSGFSNFNIFTYGSGDIVNIVINALNGNISVLFVANGDVYLRFEGIGSADVNDYIELSNIMLFDLTLEYGAGNEPTLAEFETILADAPEYFETWSYNYYEDDPYISDFACKRYIPNLIENGDFSIYDFGQWNIAGNLDIINEKVLYDIAIGDSGYLADFDLLDLSHIYYQNINVDITDGKIRSNGVDGINDYIIDGIYTEYGYATGTSIILSRRDNTEIHYITIDDVMLFDLTAEYGKGNEPSLVEWEIILNDNLVDGYTDGFTYDSTCWMSVEQKNPVYQYNENIEVYDGEMNMVWTETILRDPLVNDTIYVTYVIEKYDLEMNFLGYILMVSFTEWKTTSEGYFYYEMDYVLPDPLLTEEGYIYVVFDKIGVDRKIFGAGYVFREPSTQFLTAYNDGTNDVRTLYDAIGVNNSPYLDIISSYQFENNYNDYLVNEDNPLLLTHFRINVTDFNFSSLYYYSQYTDQEIIMDIELMYENYCDLTMSRVGWIPVNTYECAYYVSYDTTLPYLFDYLDNNIVYTPYLIGVVSDYGNYYINYFDDVGYSDNRGVYTYGLHRISTVAIGETPIYNIDYFHEMNIVNHQIRNGRNLYLDIYKHSNYLDNTYIYQYLYDNNTMIYDFDISDNENQSIIMEVFDGLNPDDATVYYHLQNIEGAFHNGALEDAYDVYISDSYIMTSADPFPDKVDDWMDDLGMNSLLGKILISVVLLVLVTIGLWIFTHSFFIVLIVDFLIIALLAVLNIIPLWIILVLIMMFFGGLFIKNRGGD